MPTVTTLGTSSSIPGNIVFTLDTQPVRYPSYYLQPNLRIDITNSFDGTKLTFRSTALGASISYGYDIGVSSATVELTEIPAGFGQDAQGNELGPSQYSKVEIFAGDDPKGPNFEALRFSGLYLRTDATMWPHVYSLVCKGNLYRAMQFRQKFLIGLPTALIPEGFPVGRPLIDATDDNGNVVINGYFAGTLGVDSTDGNIVYDILSGVPSLAVNRSDIGGTDNVIVASVADLIWPPYRSAWDQIQLLDQTFLGFRTYEDVGGIIRRVQIFGYPFGVADTAFTEGIDIWEAQGTRTVEPLINGVYVEGSVGAAVGLPNGLVFAFIQESNPFQSVNQPVIEQFRSPLIETADADTNTYAHPRLNANRVGEWRLAEGNRQLVNVTLTTFRDDLLHSGHSVAVDIPHAAVTEPVWIQHVDIRITAQPALFQQTISGLGGGLPGFGSVLTGTGTKSLGGTTVTGVGTSFTTQVTVGKGIEMASDNGGPTESRVVTAVTSDTTLVVGVAWLYNGANQQITETFGYSPPP